VGYTLKLQSNAVWELLLIRMSQRNHADDRDSATESKFYLPAGVTLSSETSWFGRLWATLFNHRV